MNGPQGIAFYTGGTEYNLSTLDINRAFDAPLTGIYLKNDNFITNTIWPLIVHLRTPHYQSGVSKTSMVKNSVFQFILRFLTHTLFVCYERKFSFPICGVVGVMVINCSLYPMRTSSSRVIWIIVRTSALTCHHIIGLGHKPKGSMESRVDRLGMMSRRRRWRGSREDITRLTRRSHTSRAALATQFNALEARYYADQEEHRAYEQIERE